MASSLHPSTFEYLNPTAEQKAQMEEVRAAAKAYADVLDRVLPPSADKTHTLRKLREVGMWANVAITRQADGAPRI